ncbi:endonuclease domain-containing protein [Candidatus Haliotispira prima]|uniref:Endonuclease domain-containing protein n=1 Tax=Candidatus Haliotispira prima TaxID=3034016 RepID=A0ABY8MFA1_9SPIO|nr:Hpy99I family type II restriction endonuclease [Candidatus Haliotispira prima]WGK68675.1 endonuclease domain-containing protein [Candidatus Haliotispira prima]
MLKRHWEGFMMEIGLDTWVCCLQGKGYLHDNGFALNRERHFKKNSVGIVKDIEDEFLTVWLIGTDETWDILPADVVLIDILQTGDKHEKKICNICHCLLPPESFPPNQKNPQAITRRSTCKTCRISMDQKVPKSKQAKEFEKNKPTDGTPFKCPICQKVSITGVTVKVMADYNYRTGNIRDFICDSCNTGLGRFTNGRDCLEDALNYIREREK